MSRLIVKSDYLKASAKAHTLENLNYIATRDGVQLNDADLMKSFARPLNASTAIYAVSDKQYDLIHNLISTNSNLSEMIAYDEYAKNANMYTASCFIADAVESLIEVDFENKDYLKYISERPGVQISGNTKHGLFDAYGASDLEKTYDDLKMHQGNVWRHIISLHREDAKLYGFEKQDAWKNLINNNITQLANDMGLSLDKLRWTAAFHDESYHPHIHMMVWSSDPKEGFQNVDDIKNFKRNLTKEIFSNEIWLREQFKAEIRDEFEDTFKQEFNHMINHAIKSSSDKLPEIANKLQNLAGALPDRKKQYYAYLKPEVKQLCDNIVKDILNTPAVEPLLKKYLESQRILASMYMKDGSIAMRKYMEDTVNGLIEPKKQDRKVIQNYIVSMADEIKVNKFNQRVLLSSKLITLDDKLKISNQEEDPQLGKSLMKLQYLRGMDPMDVITSVSSYFPNKEKTMECYLDVKNESTFSKEDLQAINRKFDEDITYEQSIFKEEMSFSMNSAAKVFQQVLIGLGNGKVNSEREAHRLYVVNRQEERNLKIQNKKVK